MTWPLLPEAPQNYVQPITLEQAQQALNAYMQAELAIVGGAQSYQIGNRSLTKVDMRIVADRIKYWSKMVDRLQNGTRGPRVTTVIARDR